MYDVPLPEPTSVDDYYCSRLEEGLELKTWKETKLPEITPEIIDTYLEKYASENIIVDSNEFDEIFDSPEVVNEAVLKIVELLKNATHTVIYTGAGISTSAQIPDFRGPQGAWTLRDKGQHASGVEMVDAFPTYAHCAITELVKQGLVKFVISTNMDGLHRRSGLPAENIVELHGNTYREICEKCNKEYMRSFDVTDTVVNYRDHITMRNCDDCGGRLKDTIVHFCENMRDNEIRLAEQQARKADLALVMGTSMNVHPAASLCNKALRNKNGSMVIVNLQKTPYDNVATVKLHCKTDEFMKLLMEKLGLDMTVTLNKLHAE